MISRLRSPASSSKIPSGKEEDLVEHLLLFGALVHRVRMPTIRRIMANACTTDEEAKEVARKMQREGEERARGRGGGRGRGGARGGRDAEARGRGRWSARGRGRERKTVSFLHEVDEIARELAVGHHVGEERKGIG